MAYQLLFLKWTQLESCLKGKGVTYYFPSGRSDGFMYQTGNAEGLTKFHIHSIEQAGENEMVFSNLLAKSSNWRDGEEPDLANIPTSSWESECNGMDSSVIVVVKALAECFASLGATGPS